MFWLSSSYWDVPLPFNISIYIKGLRGLFWIGTLRYRAFSWFKKENTKCQFYESMLKITKAILWKYFFFWQVSTLTRVYMYVLETLDLSAVVCSVKTLLSLRWLWRRLAEMSVVYHSPKLPVNYEDGSSAM